MREKIDHEAGEIRLMETPICWPNYPILPVKKRNPNGSWPTFGILTSVTDMTIFEVNAFVLPETEDLRKWLEENVPPEQQHKFESAEEAVQAGWRVD